MSIDLNREKLKALANELAKDIKTEKDLKCPECRAAENDR